MHFQHDLCLLNKILIYATLLLAFAVISTSWRNIQEMIIITRQASRSLKPQKVVTPSHDPQSQLPTNSIRRRIHVTVKKLEFSRGTGSHVQFVSICHAYLSDVMCIHENVSIINMKHTYQLLHCIMHILYIQNLPICRIRKVHTSE